MYLCPVEKILTNNLIFSMKTRLLLLSFFVACVCEASAQGPNNTGTYYQNADGKKGSELKTAMNAVINPHTQRTYNQLWTDFQTTDAKPNGKVWDMYSNKREFTFVTDQAGSYGKEGDVYNREHSFPKSWFNDEDPMYTDLFHLYPTDGWVNGQRSNDPFGEVGSSYTSSANGFSKWGNARSGLGYSGKVFEPNAEYKGDFARTYFYMVTCYETYKNSTDGPSKYITSWSSPMLDNQVYPGLAEWALNMLMRWAKADPVSEKEINRNAAVYGIQGNRNPFIDYPGLEDYIWGTLKDKAFSYDNYEGGASGEVVPTIAMPTFSPDAGTYYNSVTVSINCATEGATIYYTTNGADASEQSLVYTGSIEIAETSTIKAIAIKDGQHSAQAVATYTITDEPVIPGDVTPVDCDVVINNALFGSSANGTIAKSDDADLTGSQNGITFVYALGSGNQRYANATEIRLYNGNTLTISVAEGKLTALDFTIGSKTSPLSADTGSFSEFKWTGNASQVIITSSSNTALRNVKVSVNMPSAIDNVKTTTLSGRRVIYNLSGQRVANPTHGIYIVDGKKVLIP